MQRLLAVVFGGVLLVLGLMFSAVILVAGAVIGLIAWGYLWWKTREIRRAMREAQTAVYRPPSGNDVIEGEAVVVDESGATKRQGEDTDTNATR